MATFLNNERILCITLGWHCRHNICHPFLQKLTHYNHSAHRHTILFLFDFLFYFKCTSVFLFQTNKMCIVSTGFFFYFPYYITPAQFYPSEECKINSLLICSFSSVVLILKVLLCSYFPGRLNISHFDFTCLQ